LGKKEKVYIAKFIYPDSISIPSSFQNYFFFAFLGTKYPMGENIFLLLRAPSLVKAKRNSGLSKTHSSESVVYNPRLFSIKLNEFYELVFGEKMKNANDFLIKFWNNLFWLIDGFWTHSSFAPTILKNPFSRDLQIDLHCLISQYKQPSNQGCAYPFCLPVKCEPKNDINGLNAKEYPLLSDVFLVPTSNPSIWIPFRAMNVTLVWPHFKDNTIPDRVISVGKSFVKILFSSTIDENHVLKNYAEQTKGSSRKRIDPIDGSNRVLIEECIYQIESLKTEERNIYLDKSNVSVFNRLIRHWLYQFTDFVEQDDPIISNYIVHGYESRLLGFQTRMLDLDFVKKWFWNTDNIKKVLELSFGQLEKYPIQFSHYEVFWKNLIKEFCLYSMPSEFKLGQAKITFAVFICLTSLIELFIINNPDFVDQYLSIETPKSIPSLSSPPTCSNLESREAEPPALTCLEMPLEQL
jgi:hypothetical protein